MNYTLHQLQVFLKISQTLSVTKAAEELHLTQPAVSIQLKKFQDQFKIPLTEVIGRQLYITDFGREIATAAENILNEVYAINYKTNAFKGKLSGRLKISVVSTGKYVMPYYLTDFLHTNDEVELELDVTNKSKVIKSLRNNEVDFALVSVLPSEIDIESEVLLENKLVMVGNKDIECSDKNEFSDFMYATPFLFRENGSATRQAMETFIKKNNYHSKMSIQLTSNEAIKQAVIANLGVSIMPIIGLKNELDNGILKTLEVEGLPIITNWRIIWMKGKKFSPVSNAFLKHIKEEKNNIATKYFSWISAY